MEKLSARKRCAIVGDYLSGLSYSEIAAKQHVSTGAVANVVADFKAGRFPEVGELGEQIEQLKELSLDLKRANLTPGKCALGLMVLARIKECSLEPADIDRWPLILKSVANEDEAQQFVKLIYGIQEVQKRTGLSIDALHDEVHELEKKAAELEPVSAKLDDCKKQIVELTRQRSKLSGDLANLEEKRKLLNPRVKELESREGNLSRHIAEMEPRVLKVDETLATFGKEMQRLRNIGFTFEELTEFCQKLQAVAHRHNIKPGELRSRLLHELETINKVLGLEALLQNQQQELEKIEQAIIRAKNEQESTKAVVNSLNVEKTNLEASIKETREQVVREIVQIIPVAKDTVEQLTKELHSQVDKAMAGVSQLRDQSLEAGKEVGRYEGMLQVNEWLNELAALIRGEESIEGRRVRIIASAVIRGMSVWIKRHSEESLMPSSLSSATDTLLRELEQWKV
jgi:chromosome segregation ATPase